MTKKRIRRGVLLGAASLAAVPAGEYAACRLLRGAGITVPGQSEIVMLVLELMLAAILFAWYHRSHGLFVRAENGGFLENPFPPLHLTSATGMTVLLFCFSAVFASSAVSDTVVSLIPGGNGSVLISAGDAAETAPAAFHFLYLVAAAPLFEELAVRGALFGGLRSVTGFWGAALLSTAFWALWHGNIAQLISTLLLGPALCLLCEQTGRLLPALLLHILNNLLAFFTDTGIFTFSTGTDAAPRVVIPAALFAVYVYFFVRVMRGCTRSV